MTAINKPMVKPKNKVKERRKLKHPKQKQSKKNIGSAMKKAHEIGDNLDLNWLSNNVSYIAFLTLLVLLYILNVRNAEKIYKNVGVMSNTVKELRWEYTTKKANAEKITNKANILDLVAKQNLNLQPVKEVPAKMILD